MTQATLRWRPTATTGTLATVTLVGLGAAVALHSSAPLAIVAPSMLWLAYFGRPPLPRRVEISANAWPRRCEEGQDVTAALDLKMSPASARIEARCDDANAVLDNHEYAGGADRWRWQVPAHRWGRDRICQGDITISSRGGLWAARLQIAWPAVEVLPKTLPLRETVRSPRVRNWPGARPAREAGPGTEANGVSPYVRGMPMRHVNWRQTLRHRSLHVTTFAADRAQDLVLVVDGTVEVGPEGEGSVDRAVRGAAALARAHIQAGDRVGLVTITPAMSWVSPGLGNRHLVRLLQALLPLRESDSVVPPDLNRVPPAVVPVGSLVVLLSPLLSEQSVAIAGDLRRRGHPVLLVDVLPGEPPPSGDRRHAATALRLWRLERRATVLALEDRGIRVLRWPPEADLDATIAAALAWPAAAGRTEVFA